MTESEAGTTRRTFLKSVAAAAGGVAIAGSVSDALAFTARSATRPASATMVGGNAWADRVGLELWTVRDVLPRDFVGTLEKVARIGYTEIEPATGYGGMSPKEFRALLDRLHLTAPSTHTGITAGANADVEKQLADLQVMGVQYASLDDAPARPPRPQQQRQQRRPAPAATSPAAQRAMMEQFVRRMAQPRPVDDVKREAARYNEYGKVAQRHGIKLLIHNHTVEFIPCQGSNEVPYTILLRETDPELVVFQMDIGWATVAGQDPVALFTQHPGRFPLWHVKDAACLKCLPPATDMGARMVEARLVPVGTGDIDYAEIFKHATVAGLKHFAVEQDSAADWGDSVAAAGVSYRNLRAMLSGKA